MTINKSDVLKQVWAKVQAMPAEELFTPVELLESLKLPDVFDHEIFLMLHEKVSQHGNYRRIVNGEEQPLIYRKAKKAFYWADLTLED